MHQAHFVQGTMDHTISNESSFEFRISLQNNDVDNQLMYAAMKQIYSLPLFQSHTCSTQHQTRAHIFSHICSCSTVESENLTAYVGTLRNSYIAGVPPPSVHATLQMGSPSASPPFIHRDTSETATRRTLCAWRLAPTPTTRRDSKLQRMVHIANCSVGTE